MRPRQDGSWTVGLTLPGLHPLVAYRPAFREPLETSYLTVNGSDDDLPPGTLLYGRRRVTLDRWPDASKPLVDLESDDGRLRDLLAELTLPSADVWLFRVQADGTTREVTGRRVRPGESYVVLRPSKEAVDLPGTAPLRLECDGATAARLDVPDAPSPAVRSALRLCGIEVASSIEVWPAGPPPASWDGAGAVEWLAGAPTTIGLATDAPVAELTLSLDGGPPWSLGALDPGTPAFVSLGTLPVGTHLLDAEALVDDGADGAVAQGRLEVRVRDRAPWTASASEAAPLHIRVSPPQPDLDELWAGDVAVDAWGPPGAALRVRVDFLKTADAPAFATRTLPKLRLPVAADAWRSHVAQHLVADEAAGKLADQAALVRLFLDGHELGSTVVDVERHQRALRWIVDGQNAQLIDDRGADEEVETVLFDPTRPLQPTPLDGDEAFSGLSLLSGGLLVARSGGDTASALVLPRVDRSQGLAALGAFTPDCDLGTTRRAPADICRLLEKAALWGDAHHAATSLVGSSLRRHVLRCVTDHLAHLLAGPNWARDEDRARQGPRLRLDELALAVPPKGERGAWQGRLRRLADADSARDRVYAFDDLALWLKWLPGTYGSARLAADATQRRTLGPDHSAWTAEFSLRLASAPHTLPAWAGSHLEAALALILDATHLFRAARYAVVASASDAPTETVALYPTWTWPSPDLTPDTLRTVTAEALGAPWNDAVPTTTLLAAALRQAAGVLCPCPPGALVRHVAGGLRGLVPDSASLDALVNETLDALVAYGDLLELVAPDEPGGRNRRLLYAAPPSFVVRPSADVYLVGVAPEQDALLPPALDADVRADGVARRLPKASKPTLAALRDLGLVDLPDAVWLWAPAKEAANRFVARLDALLDKEDPVTSVDAVEAFDPASPTDRYRARWTLAPSLSGRTVVRRSQRYGAPLWGYADLDAGRVTRLLNLPVVLDKHAPAGVRACDQGWRILAALDAAAGRPQRLRRRDGGAGSAVLDLFAPPPAWLARRWTVLGRPADRADGALFSFALPASEAAAEIRFAADHLWLSHTP